MREIAPMGVDIVIVNYNSTDHLLLCLESIYSSLGKVGARIIVQDNNSTDGVDRVISRYPEVALTKNGSNLGFARAVNNGIRQSRTPYLVLLNPDTLVRKGFFEAAIDYMEKNPTVGIMGPRISNPDGSVQGSARSFPTPMTAFFGRSSMLTRLFPGNPITRKNVLTEVCDGVNAMEVDWVSGASMVVRRAAVEGAGLMDERFFMYWEDADWCRRIRHNGWKVVYFPCISVLHYVGVSSSRLLFRSILEFHKSSYRLYAKYSRLPAWIISPAVVTGLSLRFAAVLTGAGIGTWLRRRKEGPHHPETDSGKKIKVLRMIARLNIGGPAIHVCMLDKGLNGEKFDPVLYTGKISSQEGDMSYLFEGLARKPIVIPELRREIDITTDLKALLRIFNILRRERPDIVHTHTAKAGTSARLATLAYNFLFRKRVGIVHTFHGHVFEGYFTPAWSRIFVLVERALARITDVVIVISDTQKWDLERRYRIAQPHKIRNVGLGFDLEPFFNCRKVRGNFRRQHGIAEDILLIGIIGRLVHIKNHRMFLDAARTLLERHPQRRINFIVAGDGELRSDLEGFSKKAGLDGTVRFCGWIKDVRSVYADLDILALTSLNEGTPVSIIEAMAASVPVVATAAGGVLDLLGNPRKSDGNGFTRCERGILCPKNDVEVFAAGMDHLIQNVAEKTEMVQKARDFAARKFAQGRLIRDIETLYEDLLQAKRQRSEVRGQRSEVRDQRSEIRGQRSEIRGQRSEVRSQRSEVRDQRSEIGGQRSEVRGQRSEIRGQRSEIRDQRSEIRDQRSEIRDQRSEVRSQRSEVRDQRSEIGGRRSEVRGQRSEARGQRSEIRGQRSEIRGLEPGTLNFEL